MGLIDTIRRVCCGLAAALPLLWAAPGRALEPYTVTLPSSSPDGDSVTLTAHLYRPPGPGPFPAVVGLHGCSGLVGHDARLFATYRDWGERLSAAGYVLLLPDSFGGRGIAQLCTKTERSISPRRERAQDAYAALRWLEEQPFVRAEAVQLIGWSHGGSSTLAAISTAKAGLRASVPHDFRAAIAFYPGCRGWAEAGWTSAMPLLILMGAADNWTPAAPCVAMTEAVRGRGAPVEIVIYPGAYHSFDSPDAPLRERKGLAYTADGSGVAKVGTDPAARADAIARVPAYLAAHLPR